MQTLIEALQRHLADRHAVRTQKTYTTIATTFAKFTDTRGTTGEPSRADVEAFLSRPTRDGRRRAVETRNQELLGLRSLARVAIGDANWTIDPTIGIPLARRPKRDPAVLNLDEVRLAFRSAARCSRPHERARNLAILAVLAHGLRVHELVALDVGQLDQFSGTLLSVHGKGGSIKDVPLGESAIALVAAWHLERATRVPADEPALFVSGSGPRLSIRAVQHFVTRLRHAMGTSKKLSPHTLRHSFATGLLTLGVDLPTVSGALRHADIRSTMNYLHLASDAGRIAVRLFNVAIPPEILPSRADHGNIPHHPSANSQQAPISVGLDALDVHCLMDDETRRAA